MIDAVAERSVGRAGTSGRARARRCVATRDARPAEALIRFVVGPDRRLVPDLAARLPGRGHWVSSDREILGAGPGSQPVRQGRACPGPRARRSGRTGRGRCWCAAASTRIGLARRAGELVVGFDQVADWLRHGRCGLVLCARDGALRRAAPDRGPGRRAPVFDGVRPCRARRRGRSRRGRPCRPRPWRHRQAACGRARPAAWISRIPHARRACQSATSVAEGATRP